MYLLNPFFLIGEAWKERVKKVEFQPGGTVYEAMMLCRQGTSVAQAKECQPSPIDAEDLPWPLFAPWSGSFLTSANPSRDLVAHGIFADIEEKIVDSYRERMFMENPDICQLRIELRELLQTYMPEKVVFGFPDGIDPPALDPETTFETRDKVLLNERLKASHSRYASQVEEIIKFCAKQPVMLVHPEGEKDSAEVREAFDDFIYVSGGVVIQLSNLPNVYYRG